MKGLILTCGALILVQGAFAADKKDAPDGKALFAAKCASCHGKDAKGSPAMAKMYKLGKGELDLTAAKASDEELKKIIKGGKNKMPKFEGKLSDPEIDAVVAYVKSLAPAQKDAK